MATPQKKITETFKQSASPLKITQFKGHSIHLVEANNPQSLALFSRAYKEVYEPAFPIEEERISLENFTDIIKQAEKIRIFPIVILGDNLDTPAPVIKGVIVGCYYEEEDAGLLAYTVTSPQHRNQGLGRIQAEAMGHTLLEIAKSKGKKLRGYFLECNDPEKVRPENDSFDPATRIKIFQKWGAKIIPIDYVQPPLDPGADKCDTLLLLAYPHPETGQHPTPEDVRCFIKGIYASLEECSGCPPESNPDYLKIMQQLDALKKAPPPPGPSL